MRAHCCSPVKPVGIGTLDSRESGNDGVEVGLPLSIARRWRGGRGVRCGARVSGAQGVAQSSLVGSHDDLHTGTHPHPPVVLKLCGPLGIQRLRRLADAVQPQLIKPRKLYCARPGCALRQGWFTSARISGSATSCVTIMMHRIAEQLCVALRSPSWRSVVRSPGRGVQEDRYKTYPRSLPLPRIFGNCDTPHHRQSRRAFAWWSCHPTP